MQTRLSTKNLKNGGKLTYLVCTFNGLHKLFLHTTRYTNILISVFRSNSKTNTTRLAATRDGLETLDFLRILAGNEAILTFLNVVMMVNFLIFLPEDELLHWRGYLYGVVVEFESGTAVYVLGNTLAPSSTNKIVGSIDVRRKYPKQKQSNWISIVVCNDHIEEVYIHNKPSSTVTSVVFFDKRSMKRAQLLEKIHSQDDYICHLVREVKKERMACLATESKIAGSRVMMFISRSLDVLFTFFEHRWVVNLVKMSSYGMYLKNMIKITNVLQKNVLEQKKLNVEFLNFIWARVSDAILGVLIIFSVTSYTSPNDIFEALTQFQEYIVVTLENTVEWLMGSPAGFKLNYPLNNVLGPFYQFHIALWGTFLKLCNPVLKIVFNILLLLGSFGFSFQVAIVADLLAVVSVHMYCIYVYASRIHFLQIEALKILSRLFIGKKRKPLLGKTQSLPYTTEQLLFGTVSFTILLFLLPTTLIYYLVFTTIRILLLFISGILTRVRYFMSIFPVYVTWLWVFNPLPLTCTIRLSTKSTCFQDGTLVTRITPVCKSWLETVYLCIPEDLIKPESIEWKTLTTNLLLGNLIYPV